MSIETGLPGGARAGGAPMHRNGSPTPLTDAARSLGRPRGSCGGGSLPARGEGERDAAERMRRPAAREASRLRANSAAPAGVTPPAPPPPGGGARPFGARATTLRALLSLPLPEFGADAHE